jgi:Uma2 family endonuclease
VDEYHRLIREGIIQNIERTELLDGWIVSRMTRNPPHDVSLDKSQDAIRPCLPTGWRLRVQSAITLSGSEPEPDLAVVAGPADRYLASHPKPADIAALIEISDSSLQEDREVKGPIYARERIPVYWIINLVESRVEVYTDPTGPGAEPDYRTHRVFGIGEQVPLVIAGVEVGMIPVKDLLPAFA